MPFFHPICLTLYISYGWSKAKNYSLKPTPQSQVKLLYLLYKGFTTTTTKIPFHCKNKWEKEGNLKIIENECENYCKFQCKCTSLHTWRKFECKCLLYDSKVKNAQAWGNHKCYGLCGSQDENQWYIFWHCPFIRCIWLEMHKTQKDAQKDIFHTKVPFQFITFTLGNLSSRTQETCLVYWNLLEGTLSQGLGYFQTPFTIEERTDLVSKIYIMEKITFLLRPQTDNFTKILYNWD